MFNWNLAIVKRTDAMRGKDVVLPRRWVVERSFAWVHRLLRGVCLVFKQLPNFSKVFLVELGIV